MNRNKLLSIVICLSIIVSIAILAIPDTVKADAAPPPGAVGSTLFPNVNQTKVRMEAETVLLTIPEHSDYDTGHAIVTATFYMRNMGNETEEMEARFPMNMSEYDLGYEFTTKDEYCVQIYDYPSIENFSVIIDGEETNIITTTSTVKDRWSTSETTSYITLNCWAHFDVVFPPDEQVIIEVQYKVPGYKIDRRFVRYSYVLQTGTGWYDTIGSADIVVKLPYDLDESIIQNCQPADCTIDDNSVRWHYEDFEPQDNIEIEMIEPSIWSRVVRETLNVQSNSSDGEAWGRLGLAYKELVTERHGFIVADQYPEFFEESLKAYQNAIYLLPYDTDWHIGYSDLVCPYAVEAFYTNQEDAKEFARICGIEIDTILKQNPNNPNIIQYLHFLYNTYPAFFVENNFNIFADEIRMPTLAVISTKPAATETAVPTSTQTATAAPVQQTPTERSSSDSIATPTVNPFFDAQQQEPYNDESVNPKGIWFSFIGNLVLLGLAVLFYSLKNKQNPIHLD